MPFMLFSSSAICLYKDLSRTWIETAHNSSLVMILNSTIPYGSMICQFIYLTNAFISMHSAHKRYCTSVNMPDFLFSSSPFLLVRAKMNTSIAVVNMCLTYNCYFCVVCYSFLVIILLLLVLHLSPIFVRS